MAVSREVLPNLTIFTLLLLSTPSSSRCWRHRKVLGGGMRQAGVLAAAGIYALDHIAPKLHEDHANAQILAKGVWIDITVPGQGNFQSFVKKTQG